MKSPSQTNTTSYRALTYRNEVFFLTKKSHQTGMIGFCAVYVTYVHDSPMKSRHALAGNQRFGGRKQQENRRRMFDN